MIYTVTFNPALDYVIAVDHFVPGQINRTKKIMEEINADNRIVEMIELPDHPWFVGTQAHPELKSRPNRPHPLFKGFIEASLKNQDK